MSETVPCCYPVLEPNETTTRNRAVLKLVNGVRSAHGVHRLMLDAQLSRTALAKAKHMVEHRYFDHDSPDGQGLADSASGECIGLNYPTICRAVEGWRTSEGHHNAMVNPRYRYLGVGYAEKLIAIDGKPAKYFWVAHFS